MTQRLNNKIAVVIGAGSIGDGASNGSAAAVTFARHGATVLCADISPKAADRTVTEIEALGGKASAFQVDVAKTDQIDATIGIHPTAGEELFTLREKREDLGRGEA